MTNLDGSPTYLNLDDPSELLAYIPYGFGFQPDESLALLSVATTPQGANLGLLARANLGDLLNPHLRDGVRAGIAHGFQQQRTHVVYIVVYDRSFFAEAGARSTPRIARIQQELAWWFDQGLSAPGRTYLVAPSAWRCLICQRTGHCPPAGNPTDELRSTQISAAMVLHGRTIASRREELITLPATPPAGSLSPQVAAEAARLRTSRIPLRSMRWRSAAVGQWTRAISSAHARNSPAAAVLQPDEYALLALSLHDVRIRDSVIYGLCTGKRLPNPGSESEAHFARLLNGDGALAPGEMAPALTLLEYAARHCPMDLRAPILGTWAWCHWWAGNGAHAAIALDLARRTDSAYSLAKTLDRILRAKVPPPPIRARTSPMG